MVFRHQSHCRKPEELLDGNLVGVIDGEQDQADVESAVAKQADLLFAGQTVEGDLGFAVTFGKNPAEGRQQIGVEIRNEANFQASGLACSGAANGIDRPVNLGENALTLGEKNLACFGQRHRFCRAVEE